MTQYVGIRSSNIHELSYNQYEYVRDALLFDRIAVLNLDNSKELIKYFFCKSDRLDVNDVINNLNLLEEKGIIYQPDLQKEILKIKDESIYKTSKAILDEPEKCGFEEREGSKFGGEGRHFLFVSNAKEERCLNLILNAQEDTVSVPLLNIYKDLQICDDSKCNSLTFILNNIPYPTEIRSLDQVIEFKREGKSGLQYLRLKDFINRLSKESLSKSEIEDRLCLLIKESERDFHQFDIRTENTNLELCINVASNFIDNLIKLNIIKALSSHLKIKETKIQLTEAENKILDKELMYINLVKDSFIK